MALHGTRGEHLDHRRKCGTNPDLTQLLKGEYGRFTLDLLFASQQAAAGDRQQPVVRYTCSLEQLFGQLFQSVADGGGRGC